MSVRKNLRLCIQLMLVVFVGCDGSSDSSCEVSYAQPSQTCLVEGRLCIESNSVTTEENSQLGTLQEYCATQGGIFNNSSPESCETSGVLGKCVQKHPEGAQAATLYYSEDEDLTSAASTCNAGSYTKWCN